jgi:hypothetical protein
LERARQAQSAFPDDPGSAAFRSVNDVKLDKLLALADIQKLKAALPGKSEEEIAKQYFQNRKKASLEFRQQALARKEQDTNYVWTAADDAEFEDVFVQTAGGRSQLQRAGDIVIQAVAGLPDAVKRIVSDTTQKALASSAKVKQDIASGKQSVLGATVQAVKDAAFGIGQTLVENVQGVIDQGAELGELAYDVAGLFRSDIVPAKLEAKSELQRMKVRRATRALMANLADAAGVDRDSLASALGQLYGERVFTDPGGVSARRFVNPADLTNKTVEAARKVASPVIKAGARSIPAAPVAAGIAVDTLLAGSGIGAGTVIGAMISRTANRALQKQLRKIPALNKSSLVSVLDDIADDVAKAPGDIPLGDWLAANGRSAVSRKVGDWLKSTTAAGNFSRGMLTTAFGIPLDAFTGGTFAAASGSIGQEAEAAAYGAAATGMVGALAGILGGNRAAQIQSAFDATAKRGEKLKYGVDPELDVIHAQTLAKADAPTRRMVNYMRGGTDGRARVYFVTEGTIAKRGLSEGAEGMAIYRNPDGKVDIFIDASKHSTAMDQLRAANPNWAEAKGLVRDIAPDDTYSLSANAKGVFGHEAAHALFHSLPKPVVDTVLEKVKDAFTDAELQAEADRYNRLIGSSRHNAKTIINEIAADLAGRQFALLTGFTEFTLPPTMSGKAAAKFDGIVEKVGQALGEGSAPGGRNTSGTTVVRNLLRNYFRISDAEVAQRMSTILRPVQPAKAGGEPEPAGLPKTDATKGPAPGPAPQVAGGPKISPAPKNSPKAAAQATDPGPLKRRISGPATLGPLESTPGSVEALTPKKKQAIPAVGLVAK